MYQKTGPNIIELGLFNFERLVEPIHGLVIRGRILRSGKSSRGRRIVFGLRVRNTLIWPILIVIVVVDRLLRLLKLLLSSPEGLVGIIVIGRLSTHADCDIDEQKQILQVERGKKRKKIEKLKS